MPRIVPPPLPRCNKHDEEDLTDRTEDPTDRTEDDYFYSMDGTADNVNDKVDHANNASNTWTRSEVAVYFILLGQLLTDFAVAWRGLRNDAICCGQPMHALSPNAHRMHASYLILIASEILLLVVRLVRDLLAKHTADMAAYYYDNNQENERGAADNDNHDFGRGVCCTLKECCSASWNSIYTYMLLNPFIGAACLWTQMSLIERSAQAWTWLAVEITAVLFWYLAVYLSHRRMAPCTLLLQSLYWMPVAFTAFYMWYLQHQTSGICYLVAADAYWVEGCDMCADGLPPNAAGCPGGYTPVSDSFCNANAAESFCFFAF